MGLIRFICDNRHPELLARICLYTALEVRYRSFGVS